MAYSLTLPDGSVVRNIPDNVPRNKAFEILEKNVPDAFPTLTQEILGIPKEVVKGAATGIVGAASGLASLPYTAARAAFPGMTPYEETAVGRKAGQLQEALAPGYGTIAQVSGGLGQLASMIGPQVALRAPALAATALGRAASPLAYSQAAGMGAEEQRQRVVAARGEGKEVTPGTEALAQLGGAGIGLTDILPWRKVLKGIPKNADDAFKFDLLNLIKRSGLSAAKEGGQEVVEKVANDLLEKGLYNPDLKMNDSLLGYLTENAGEEFKVGAAVGGIAQLGLDVLLRKEHKARYMDTMRQKREQEFDKRRREIEQEEAAKLAGTKAKTGGDPDLGQPSPAAPVSRFDEPDPVLNPLGNFSSAELPKDLVTSLNQTRKKQKKDALQSFSVEDLVDSGAPQDQIDTFISAKLSNQGIDPANEVEAADILDAAAQRGFDSSTPSFSDFLRRTTGQGDVDAMTPVQRLAAFTAVQSVPEGVTTIPSGTNAQRFSTPQYKAAMASLQPVLPQLPTRDALVKTIQTKLPDPRDAESVLQTAVRRGEIAAVDVPSYEVTNPITGSVRTYNNPVIARSYAERLNTQPVEVITTKFTTPDSPSALPGAPEVRPGQYSEEPDGFELYADGVRLAEVKKAEDVEAKAERLEVMRLEVARRKEEEIRQAQQKILDNQRKLEEMEALGKAGSPEYKAREKQTAADNKALQSKVESLTADQKILASPLNIQVKPRKTQAKGFTVFQNNQPVAYFTNKAAAEEGIYNLYDDQTLQDLATKKPNKAIQKVIKNRALGIAAPMDAKVEELRKQLLPAMKKLGLESVGLRIIRAIKAGDMAGDGAYTNRLVTIALDATNPMGTLRHEAIHALKELGAFTQAEWRVLENRAKSEWIQTYIKDRRAEDGRSLYDAYKDVYQQQNGNLDGFESFIAEEAIADAFKFYSDTKPPAGVIGGLFKRIQKFFESLGNAVRGAGFNTADDLFQKIETGGAKITETVAKPKESFSLRADETADKTPFDMSQAEVYNDEIESLVRRVGDRIVGMKSGQTLDDVRKAVDKIKDYAQRGIRGAEWYDRSAKAVLDAFNGDKVLAEKFFQIIAITSVNTEVAANFTKTYNAWRQFVDNKPIKAGTENENKKIRDLLYFGLDWDGRKTNTFYTNLMEAMEGTDTGRSTIDLHMTRMIFGHDKPTDAQYELAENMMRLIASKVNVPPRKIQAASWVTQKAVTLFDDYREKGFKKNLNDKELREYVFEMAVADYAHMMQRKVAGLPVNEALLEPSSEKRTRIQNVTAEVIPSVKTEMAQVANLPYKLKNELNKKIIKGDYVGKLVRALGIKSRVRVSEGTGGYQGGVTPNLIIQVINDDPAQAIQDANDISYAAAYTFKQDAVPYFRADPKLLEGQVGYRLTFDRPKLTITQERKLFKELVSLMGNDAGFTKMAGNQLVLINYRGEDGNPFLMDDVDFVNAVAAFRDAADKIVKVKQAERFGVESEYPYNDWEQDAKGTGVIAGIRGRSGERPDLQKRLDSVRKSFVAEARRSVRESGSRPLFQLRGEGTIDVNGVARPRANSAGRAIHPTEEGIRNFWKWFGSSVVVDDQGRPVVMYHGTARDIEEFDPSKGISAKATFLSPSAEFTEDYAYGHSPDWMYRHYDELLTGEQIADAKREALSKLSEEQKNRYKLSQTTPSRQFSEFREFREAIMDRMPSSSNIIPLYVRARMPWDFQNPEHVDVLMKGVEQFRGKGDKKDRAIFPVGGAYGKEPRIDALRMSIENGYWPAIEHPTIQQLIRSARINGEPFDGFFMHESGGGGKFKNLAVYDRDAVKTAVGNYGSFTPGDRRIAYQLKEEIVQNYGQAKLDRIKDTTASRDERNFIQRMVEAMTPESATSFRQKYINKYESIEKQSLAIANQFGDAELLADVSAVAAANMAERAAGIAAQSFKSGVPVYRNGFVKVDNLNGTQKGLIEVLEPLMQYNDPFVFQLFQFYGATRRGARLYSEGRERLLTPQDMQFGRVLENRYPAFKQVFDDYQQYNKQLVKFMVDTGVITPEMGRKWMMYGDYLPFYRQLDNEESIGPKIFQGISGVKPPKKLKGGEFKLDHFLETVVRNTRAAVEAGMKNIAANRVVRDSMRLNSPGAVVAQRLAPSDKGGPDVITVRERGVEVKYKVADPLLAEATKNLYMAKMPGLDILAYPTRALRELVTRDPGFMVASLFRDSASAWATTGIKFTPIVSAFKQFSATLINASPESKALQAAGLGAGYEFKGDIKASARELEKQLRSKSKKFSGADIAAWPVTKVWDTLGEASTAADLSTRAEVYKRVLAETGNEAEAIYQAAEVINFSRRGASPIIQVATAIVPFINARIQGLDVLYRAGFGRLASANRAAQHKAFARRALFMLALGAMYWFLASDQEEYKKADQEVRDNYWIIGPVKIPIAFELGFLFKVLPERIAEYMFGLDTGKDVKESIFRNITSTLAINPIPQAFLPLVEVGFNYSAFTGREIVGASMEDVAKPFQQRQGTTEFAKAIGRTFNVSPLQVDHILFGYTGVMGMYAATMMDSVFRLEDSGIKPAMGMEQTPVIKRFYASPRMSGSISAFYDLKKQVEEVTRTANYLQSTSRPDQYAQYMKENGMLLNLKPLISNIDKDLKALRKMRTVIDSAKDITPEQKRASLDRIREAENAVTARMREVRKAASKQ